MSNVIYENMLPDGSRLIQDEKIVASKHFPISITTFFIKAHVVATNKRFVAHFPNVVLGLFPFGFEDVNMSLKQISSVTVKVEYHLFRLICGVIFIMAGWNIGNSSAVLVILLGILLFGSGISPYLAIFGTGSELIKIPVVFWKKKEAIKFARELNAAILEQK